MTARLFTLHLRLASDFVSYILAFRTMPIALPLATLAAFLFNLELYVHVVWDDKRSLAASELKEAYAAYRRRTGMFLPRLGKPARTWAVTRLLPRCGPA